MYLKFSYGDRYVLITIHLMLRGEKSHDFNFSGFITKQYNFNQMQCLAKIMPMTIHRSMRVAMYSGLLHFCLCCPPFWYFCFQYTLLTLSRCFLENQEKTRFLYQFKYCQDEYNNASVHWWIVPHLFIPPPPPGEKRKF